MDSGECGGSANFNYQWGYCQPQVSISPFPKQYKYVVRFINPDQKSKYVTKIWHNEHTMFKSVCDLKRGLCESFEDKLNGSENFVCGFLEKNCKTMD